MPQTMSNEKNTPRPLDQIKKKQTTLFHAITISMANCMGALVIFDDVHNFQLCELCCYRIVLCSTRNQFEWIQSGSDEILF